MSTSKAETLRHDPEKGEVDPRTYPMLGKVRFASDKLGSGERLSQINRLVHAVDVLCESEGENRVRIHLTLQPGADAKKEVEIRIQALTRRNDKEDHELHQKVLARWPEILAKGEGRWFPA